ncbi:MAG TPA: hypothetical protein PLM51_04650 [Bacillota bacterium]|nr:hypothetical protein [Bacillota bacterium]
MEIKLKSNRKYIVYFTIPCIIFYAVFIGYMLVGHVLKTLDISLDFGWFISSLIILMLLIIVLLFAKYYKGKNYVFNEKSIEIYNKNILIKKIQISNISIMHYYPWRFHYFVTLFFGALNECGACQIYIKEINGSISKIGYISEKDAIILQEKLYSNNLEIIYDKRKNK